MVEEFDFGAVFQNLAPNIHKNNATSHLPSKTHFVGYAHHGHAFVGEVDHDVQHFTNHFGV